MAQEGHYTSSCFHGLNDADSPATLDQCESPDLLNTESNLNGTALLKRKGYSLNATMAITTAPINGSHSYIDSNGNNQIIVCQEKSCLKSTNGNAFALFLTTAATGITRWSFVDINGNLYGANNRYDPIMKWNGSVVTSPSDMPAGSILETTQSRLAVGDISGNPNRVQYSKDGDYEVFTIGVESEDPFFDDIGASGERITGLKYFNGYLNIFKTSSLTACEISDQYNSECAVRLPNIGTKNTTSIITTGDALYFRGQDNNYWEVSVEGVSQISKKIPNLIKSQTGGTGGGENSNTQTSRADWELGTEQPAGSWDTSSVNGSVLPSTVTRFGFVSASSLINVSTASGSIALSSRTAADTFADGDYTTGATTWTVTQGSWLISQISGVNYLRPDDGSVANLIHTTALNISSGSWAWTTRHVGASNCSVTGDPYCFEFRFNKSGTSYYALQITFTGAANFVKIVKNIASSETVLSSATITYGANTDRDFRVVRGTSGDMWGYVDGILYVAATDTSITGATLTELSSWRRSNPNYFKGMSWYQYYTQGEIVSQIFDTGFSTPTWGQLSSTFSVTGGNNISGQVAFYTRVSSSPNNDMWTAYSASSDTLRIVSDQKRYIQIKPVLSTYISTQTPTVSAFSLLAGTTGQFVVQCIEPASSITSWGTLSCAQTTSGAGSLVFYATSAATCATLPTSPPDSWQTSVTNNATLTIATNTAVAYGFRSLLGSATDQAQVDACTIIWNEGSAVQPSWSVYDSIKDALYWTTTISGSSSNRLLKYDRKLKSWHPFDIPAQAPRIINNSLYFGSATGGYWYAYGLVDNDLGAAINGYWKTKDIGSENPFLEKNFQKVSILTRNQGSGAMTVTSTLSNGKTGSYSVSLTTGTGLNYARSNYLLPSSSPQNFINLKFSNNNANEPFEVLGLGVDYTVAPWRVSGP